MVFSVCTTLPPPFFSFYSFYSYSLEEGCACWLTQVLTSWFQVGTQKIVSRTMPQREKCELSLQGVRSQDDINQFMNLIDDEELELRELQAGPNPLTCSAHLATNGLHSCSLCKGQISFICSYIVYNSAYYL